MIDPGRPLAGLGVLVTRNPGEWPALLGHLEALGASATFRAPTVQAPPVDPDAVVSALTLLETYAWVALASANGVRYLARAASERGIELARSGARFACVGAGTARVLASLGGRAADLVAEDGTGSGLGRALLGRLAHGERILVVRPEVSAGDLERVLRAGGADVDEVAVYRTVAAPWAVELAESVAGGLYDVVVFTAPSAARAVLEAPGVGAERVALALRRAVRVAIGPTTARALEEAALDPDTVADRPEEEAVAAAVVAAVERRRRAEGVC